MSEEVLAPIIAVLLLVGLFLWIPTLEFCGPKCQQFLHARRTRRQQKTSLINEDSASDKSPASPLLVDTL